MASRALSARLMSAAVNWLGSTSALRRSSCNIDSISICCPSVARNSFAVSTIRALMSVTFGCSGCRRANASSRWVRSAPRQAASSTILATLAWIGLAATASARISIDPVMAVRVHEIEGLPADEVVGIVVSEQPRELPVGKYDAAVVRDPDALQAEIDDLPVTGFAGAELDFGFSARGDVFAEDDDATDR